MAQVTEEVHQHSYAERREEVLARLARIEGQVRGVARMVEGDRYCVDILFQLSAIRAATEKVSQLLLGEHVKGCVQDALVTGGDEADTKVSELLAVIDKFLKV